MDTYENNSYPTPEQPAEDTTTTYHGAGAGRKESPYADSPYVIQRPAAPQASKAEPEQVPQQDSQSAYQRTYYYEPEQPQPPKPPKAKKKKAKHGFWKKALVGVLVLALVGGSCAITASVVNSRWEKETQEMADSLTQQIRDLQDQIEAAREEQKNPYMGNTVASGELMTPGQVYAMNVDSVVMIQSKIYYGQQIANTSTGSGFILTENGYVLTNHHVVEGAGAVSVVTHSGETYEAKIVGSDETNDVAVLKVEATGLPAVTLGSSKELNVGDQVAAIGNPLGELTSTMTVGYISGKERAVTTDGTTINMIQTDAAINSGNSGGPLFNMKGQVVGITTAKYSGNSSSGASIEGIGFAIPIDDVMEVAGDLLEYGYVKTAYMGITVLDLDTTVAAMYNLPTGVYVQTVEAGGPAEKAGMRPEDIIIALGNTRIETYNDLSRALRACEPGDTTTVTVFRGGQEWKLTITLTERPQADAPAQEEPTLPGSGMPNEGTFKEWYDYFAPFFGYGNNGE